MTLAVVSFFRNCAYSGQIERFLDQVQALARVPGLTIRVYAVWGDCVDHTPHLLLRGAERRGLRLTLVERSHGGPVFPSTEDPVRLKALSYVGNGGLEAVRDEDRVLYVESDLIWEPETITRLLLDLDMDEGTRCDVVAPLIVAGPPYEREDTGGQPRDVFYDIFVFRKDGDRFSPFWPYHRRLNLGGLTHVDSAGSLLVMRGDVARNCRIIEDNALLGFCKDVWAKGYFIACDARVKARQP